MLISLKQYQIPTHIYLNQIIPFRLEIPSKKCFNAHLKIDVYTSKVNPSLLYGEIANSDINMKVPCPDPVKFTCKTLDGKLSWKKVRTRVVLCHSMCCKEQGRAVMLVFFFLHRTINLFKGEVMNTCGFTTSAKMTRASIRAFVTGHTTTTRTFLLAPGG